MRQILLDDERVLRYVLCVEYIWVVHNVTFMTCNPHSTSHVNVLCLVHFLPCAVYQHNPSVQGTYVTSNEDFSKKPERRGTCSQCCYRVCRVVCAKPQIDTTALYYEDSFNDEPWECTFGTADEDGIWVNHSDKVGTMMSAIVWVLMGYSMVTISWLAQNNNLSNHIAMTYGTICSLALASHAKTMFTDPGAIPMEAVPLASLFKQGITTHAMCSHCQTYKPPNSHHCRICNRCISRMDRTYYVICMGVKHCRILI